MIWALEKDGNVICQHASKRMCVIEAYERGFVQKPSRRDFPDDDEMPELMFAPGVTIAQRPLGHERNLRH